MQAKVVYDRVFADLELKIVFCRFNGIRIEILQNFLHKCARVP